MDNKLLFTKILGLRVPWFIKQVMVDDQAQRVDIYVDHEPDIGWLPGVRYALRAL